MIFEFADGTKINYQIMSMKNSEGRYMADWNELLKSADSREEKEYILLYKEQKTDGFLFPIIYMIKSSCGHYEMFEAPFMKDSDSYLDNLFAVAKEHIENTVCSNCCISKKRRLSCYIMK